MIFIAETTLSKLASGSPIPIITTLLITRSPLGVAPSARLAHHNWPMISATVRLRLNPCLPVEQNAHSNAQPTCEDTQSVPRPVSGMKTVSMPLAAPTESSHLRVPSVAVESAITDGGCTIAREVSLVRKSFDR